MRGKFEVFESIVESVKNREMGITSLIFVKQAILKEDVIEFRQSVDDDGEVEPYTQVTTTTGECCLNITFEKFLAWVNSDDGENKNNEPSL